MNVFKSLGVFTKVGRGQLKDMTLDIRKCCDEDTLKTVEGDRGFVAEDHRAVREGRAEHRLRRAGRVGAGGAGADARNPKPGPEDDRAVFGRSAGSPPWTS